MAAAGPAAGGLPVTLVGPGVGIRVDGHALLIESLPTPSAYALAGPAADQLGAQPVIGVCAVVMVAAALAPLSLREVRHLRLTPDNA